MRRLNAFPKSLQRRNSRPTASFAEGGGEYSWEFDVEGCLISDQRHVIFYTRFQTWCRQKLCHHLIHSYLILILEMTPTKRFVEINFEFAYYSFFLIQWNWNDTIWNTLIHFRILSKTIPSFRPKLSKNPTISCGTYLHGKDNNILKKIEFYRFLKTNIALLIT